MSSRKIGQTRCQGKLFSSNTIVYNKSDCVESPSKNRIRIYLIKYNLNLHDFWNRRISQCYHHVQFKNPFLQYCSKTVITYVITPWNRVSGVWVQKTYYPTEMSWNNLWVCTIAPTFFEKSTRSLIRDFSLYILLYLKIENQLHKKKK